MLGDAWWFWRYFGYFDDHFMPPFGFFVNVASLTSFVQPNQLAIALLILEGLLDEVQIVVNPVLLGDGTPLFKDLSKTTELILKGTTVFESGKVLLVYELTEK